MSSIVKKVVDIKKDKKKCKKKSQNSNEIYVINEDTAEDQPSAQKQPQGDISNEKIEQDSKKQQKNNEQSVNKNENKQETNKDKTEKLDKKGVLTKDQINDKLKDSEHMNSILKQELQKSLDENSDLKQKLNVSNYDKNNLSGKNALFQEGQLKAYKETDQKQKNEIQNLKTEVQSLKETMNKVKTEQTKSQKLYQGSLDTKKNLEGSLVIKDEQINELKEKISQLNGRNKELERNSVEVHRKSDQIYKEKMEMETMKDKTKLQVSDLQHQCDLLKRENQNLSNTLLEKNRQANDKINEQLQKIQMLSNEIATLKQEAKDYEGKYQKEKYAKDDLRVQVKLQETQVNENMDLKKKLEKKEEKIEELEDHIDKLKSKLRKFDTTLTVKDQFGQVKEFKSESYSEILDKKQHEQIVQLQKELLQLQESMGDFRNNSYKNECERETLRVENVSLREELKRVERIKLKEQNEYESEIRDKLRTLENLRIRVNKLQEQNEELDKVKVTKLEILRDEEFSKQEKQLTEAKNKVQSLENQITQQQYKIDQQEQILNKKQLMIGDMYFQNETLKEEVEYLTNLKNNNSKAKVSRNLPLKNKENEAIVVSPQVHQQGQRGSVELNSQYIEHDKHVKHIYEIPHDTAGYPANIYQSPSHFEKDNYANYYRDTRQMMDSLNRYQSSSTVASQNMYSYY